MSLAFSVGFDSAKPLQQQIYDAIRQRILNGQLRPGEKLPATRILATALGVSRNTVIESYEQLKSEGYLQSQKGAGTFVCPSLPETMRPVEHSTAAGAEAQPYRPQRLSAYGLRIADHVPFEPSIPDVEINFRYSHPALDRVPLKQWSKLWSRHCRLADRAMLDYAPHAYGYLPLRTAIATHLAQFRSIQCSPEQVIIVSGAIQAANLVARVLLNVGDWAAIENPGFIDIRRVLQAQGVQLRPIPVDNNGLIVEHLCDRAEGTLPQLVYVTPSRQSPLGVALSLDRRLALLDWARETGSMILEEDFDSEYRYSGRPIPALQGLDRFDRVIYVNDFCEALFPTLRLGYMIVPQHLVHVFGRAKWLADRQAPMLEQRVLADFITEGYWEQHLRRMRTLYQRRRKTLTTALREAFGERVTFLGDDAGIYMTIRLESHFCDDVLIQKAAQVGVGLGSTRPFYLQDEQAGEFLMGYAELDETQILTGVRRLAMAFYSENS